MNEQIDKKCKDCLHYKMCLERFRKLKKENHYILIDESEYFAHADDCEFHITSTGVPRDIVEFLFRRSKALQNTFKDNPDSAQCFRGRFELENAATIIANKYGVELKKKYEIEGADDEQV